MSLQVPSLSMLSNPLPPVVNKPVELPKYNPEEAPEENVKAPEADKLVIILHSRDVGDYEENLCKKYGRVRHWNPSMANRALTTLECDYLFVDIREKYARVNIAKEDPLKYKWAAYAQVWEKLDSHVYDDFLDDINILTKFPDMKCTYKYEYDDLLTKKKKIKSPSSCLSLLSFLVNIFDSVKKQ